MQPRRKTPPPKTQKRRRSPLRRRTVCLSVFLLFARPAERCPPHAKPTGLLLRVEAEFVQLDGIFDGLFLGGGAVFVDVHNILRAVVEAERAVEAPAVARHAFEKVLRRAVEFELHQRGAAFVDAVHRQRLYALHAHLLRHVRDALRDAAALGEDSAVERGVVERGLFQCGDVDVARVQKRLQFLEGEHAVDRALRFGQAEFRLFARAGTDEDDLARGVGALDEHCRFDHRRNGVRNVLCKLGEVLFHEHDERGAARRREDALLLPLLRLVIERDVRAERRFHDLVEAEPADARYDLFDLRILELADDGGRDDGVHVVLFAVFALFQDLDGVHDEGLIHDRAEGALVHARAAHDALIVVDDRLFVLADGDRLDLAGGDARALLRDDRAVRARLGALAAFDALGLIHDRLVVDDLDRPFRADLLAAVHDAAAAGGRHEDAADGAFVAGDVDDLDDVGVLPVAAERELDALLHDGALLEHAAAHRGFRSRRDLLGNVYVQVLVTMLIFVADDRFEHVVFEFLYRCVENSFVVGHKKFLRIHANLAQRRCG